MLDTDRSEDILDGEILDADAPACGDRRSGAADPQPAARFARGCADGLRRQPDPPLRQRIPDAASHLISPSGYYRNDNQRGGVPGDGGAPLPGCRPGEGTSGDAALGATVGCAGVGSG